MSDKTKMQFIEMTGATLAEIINDSELQTQDLGSAGVVDNSIVRVNHHGDIELRRAHKWDIVGGLLGNFEERLKQMTGLDWA
ncbi:MAG: hypothetical protein MK106_06485 [Mariniblastus sp.]|nr:hypothetical protein [Mariniblastus sp.]